MSKRILAALMALALTVTLFSGCKTTVIPGEDESVVAEASSAKASSSASSKASSSKASTTSKKTTTTTTTTTNKNNASTAATSSDSIDDGTISVPKLMQRGILPDGWISNYRLVTIESSDVSGASSDIGDDDDGTSIYDGYKDYATFGADIFTSLSAKAWISGTNTIHEDIVEMDNTPITLWGYGAYLEGVGAATAYDSTNTAYETEYRKSLENALVYKSSDYVNSGRGAASGTYLALTCWPGGSTAEIFYDDDVWVLKEYMQAYHTLHDQVYLTNADKMLKYILETSWNDSWGYGGGLEWMDRLYRGSGSEEYQKNVCINAPATDAAMEMYELTGSNNSYLLSESRKIYDWTIQYLTAPGTDDKGRVVYDKIVYNGTSEPKYDRGELPYNYGMMISAGARIYDALKATDPDTAVNYYLDLSLDIAKKAYNKYCPRAQFIDGKWGYPWTNSNPWFSTYLVEGFLTLQSKYSDTNTSDLYLKAVKNGYAFACINRPYSEAGWFFAKVNRPTGTISNDDITIMNQGASMRTLFMLAKNVESAE